MFYDLLLNVEHVTAFSCEVNHAQLHTQEAKKAELCATGKLHKNELKNRREAHT